MIEYIDIETGVIYFAHKQRAYSLDITWLEFEAWLEVEAPCELREMERWMFNGMNGPHSDVLYEYLHDCVVEGRAREMVEIENAN